jgi:hypothetical protein
VTAAGSPGERAQLAEYLRIHTAMLALGHDLDVAGLMTLYQACVAGGLTPDDADEIFRSVQDYDLARLGGAFEVLRGSTLRFTLLADVCQMAHAARIAAPREAPEVRRLSTALGITDAQHAATAEFIAVCEREYASARWRDEIAAIRDAIAEVERSGTPVAAVSGTRPPSRFAVALADASYQGLRVLCADLFALGGASS